MAAGRSPARRRSLPSTAQATRTSRAASWRFLRDRRQRGLDLTFDHLRREWPDALVANHALAIHQERFRRAVDAKIDGRAAFDVGDHQIVRIAMFGEPTLRGGGLLLVVVADQLYAKRLAFGHQHW